MALRVLDLSSNAFSGEIPLRITVFAGLQSLNLSSNSFSGQLPAGIGGMRLLEVLDVNANPSIGRAWRKGMAMEELGEQRGSG
jgi:Leucine-rich repeat (LRR) protein